MLVEADGEVALHWQRRPGHGRTVLVKGDFVVVARHKDNLKAPVVGNIFLREAQNKAERGIMRECKVSMCVRERERERD